MSINVAGTFGFATAGEGDNGYTAELNPSADVTGQPNRRLVLGVSFYDGFGPGSSIAVTDDGPGLAWDVDIRADAAPGWDDKSMAMLWSAPFESGTLAETDTITVTIGQASYVRSLCGLILDDADNDIPIDSTGHGGDTGSTLAADLTTTVDDTCVVGFGWEDAAETGTMTPAADYTERFDYNHVADQITLMMVTKVLSAAGAQTPGATCTEGSRFVMAAVAYRDKDAPVPPINTAAPAITGIAQIGQTVGCTTGDWLGDEPLTYAYQWQRDGDPIDDATASTYLVDDADDGVQLKCTVTATNPSASVSVDSNSVIPYPTGTYDVLVRSDSAWAPSTWRVRSAGEWVPAP